MPFERWKGYIKDYDGATFLECSIHPKMDYTNISNIIKVIY
jgi:histone acetyltransferase